MRINFQENDVPKSGIQKSDRASRGVEHSGQKTAVPPWMKAYRTDFSGGNNAFIQGKQKGKSLIKLQQEAENINVSVRQDYMTVMSNTLSKEDYAKLEKEGFNFKSMSPDEVVTIVDKIKAELASSGHIVAGYNDDMDINTLSAAVGSDALARAVAESFKQYDIPLTQDNIDDVKQAWELASQLTELSDANAAYMAGNGMKPEIWDFYIAKNSGADDRSQTAPQYFAEDIKGYYTQNAGGYEAHDDSVLQEQIDKIIANAGLEINDENRHLADILMDNGLYVNAENLESLAKFKACAFPITEDDFARAAANAISEGKNPIHADISDNKNIYEKSAEILAYYMSNESWADISDNIAMRRQLEEVRLRMTAEVNVKLLKSGFSIDTAPMEQLVEALKEAEKEIADSYFPGEQDAVEKYRTYNLANDVVSELPDMPADCLGPFSMGSGEISVFEFHSQASALRDTYVKANESYEALMTAPRADLGDNIKKAFANVDNLLRDINLDINDENRRAVRILGYNHMEITPENIEKVITADSEVQGVIKKMTPASTLQMIRDGVNPLEKSFEELNAYFDENSDKGYDESSQSYSKFLYNLENKKGISEDEREAYIGVYRMLRQIEKSDGAVVGALLNTQAELHFANLLSAVRSGKFKHLDVKVQDAFGALSDIVRNDETISEQIAKGFVSDLNAVMTEVSYDEESEAAYYKSELEDIRNAAKTQDDAVSMLEKGASDVNADNLLAAQALLSEGDNIFKTLTDKRYQANHDDIWEKLSDKDVFLDEYSDMCEDFKEQTELLTQNSDSSLDVKQLRLVHKQLNVMANLAKSEEYVIPMYIGDELSKVHITMEQGGGEKGSVHIKMNYGEESIIEAHFSINGEILEGILVGNTDEEVRKLKEAADIVNDRLTNGVEGLERITSNRMAFVHSSSYVGRMSGTDAGANRTDGAENIELYRIAKLFLQSVKQN